MHSEPDYSDDLARTIDAEIRRLIDEAHQRARDILTEHRAQLEEISHILLRRETIEREEFLALLDGTPEAQVFAERDAKAAREAAERERAAADEKSGTRARAPHAARPGEPLADG
jgi:cell division protease FtsH